MLYDLFIYHEIWKDGMSLSTDYGARNISVSIFGLQEVVAYLIWKYAQSIVF
jgi:hypothetical protein